MTVQGDGAGGGFARHRLYIERFILPILAGLVLALGITNPMGFGWPARIIGIVGFFIVAGIAVHVAGWSDMHWKRLRGLWWLWIVIGLIGGTVLGSFITPSPVSDVIMNYGYREGEINATVDGTALLRYKNSSKMMLIPVQLTQVH
jgi:hypothetical protein